MQCTQTTTFAVNGTGYVVNQTIPVTPEAAEARHLESGVINVYPGIHYQTIEGFGGAMTETSAYLFSKMDPATRREALAQFFGPTGNQLTFVRVPIDSCDFSLEEYQAVEDPIADPELTTFSLKRDQLYVLPMLKEAMAMSDRPLSVLLSPWSPPKQWKTPPARPKNDLKTYGGMPGFARQTIDYDNPSRCNGGKLKPEYYGAWAKYLVKYVQAYLAEGIPVTMLSLQNESIAATNWDSCVWTAEEQKTFLRDHLYPAMKAAGLTDRVGLYIWDHNKERVLEWCQQVIDDETRDMVAGVAFHWYSGDHFEAVQMTTEQFPGLTMLFSECCPLHQPGKVGFMGFGGGGKTPQTVEYEDAVSYAHDLIGNLNAGMQRWIDWNLCVDKDGGPRHVPMGFAASMIANDDGTFRTDLIHDYIGHFSRHIQPGARRIGFSRCDDQVELTAAQNPDGTIVLVVLNKRDQDAGYAIRINGQVIRISAPARTLSTLTITED